jgi:hypothetical protein
MNVGGSENEFNPICKGYLRRYSLFIKEYLNGLNRVPNYKI